jgi:hypothetical protein
MNGRMGLVATLVVAGLALVGGYVQGGLEVAVVSGSAGALLGLLLVVSAQLSGSSQLLGGGLFVLFLGERVLGSGTERLIVSGVGLAIVIAAFVLRGLAFTRSQGRLKEAHQLALGVSSLVVAGLLVYGATLEPVVTALTTDDESITRWTGALGAIWPVLVTVGLLPTFAIDRVLANHPRVVPPRAAKGAAVQMLSAALAICLVFPVNYLAARHAWTTDVAYFRTTSAGESTLAIVKSLPEPVEAILFFQAGSDVGSEVEPYFRTLEEASGGMLTVTRVDQALAPGLAEELKIRTNGYVAYRMGESTEKFKIGDELSKAKRNLKKLDENAQKNLLKVTRGRRNAYFVVGHGEANFRERDNPLRKLNNFKKILESQNYKTQNLGPTEGLANAVPADADLVIVPSPAKPFSPAETEALTNYLDQGGAMLVMADYQDDPMTDLLGHIGVTVGAHPLAHAQAHMRQSRGPADRLLLATNRYGTHSSVRTLSKNGTTLSVILPAAIAIEAVEDPPGKVNTMVRSFPDTWEDADRNYKKGAEERSEVFDMAVAVTGPERPDAADDEPAEAWRAMVVGDVTWASDPVMQASQGNQVLLVDGVRWLLGDESISGSVESEEDVKIQHTKGQDWVWFYLTVLAVPLLVFGLGATSIRLRRRS